MANDKTIIKCFFQDQTGKGSGSKKKKSKEATQARSSIPKISAVNFGPYDNGHIVVGFDQGFVLLLDTFDLSTIT